ncbi:choline dehydrogenase [Saccharopolyspora kobensis]|uniref:Choline dehydrogenase n=1 Tax=Saccharopolyspora kobensis TaxID=146035 RepID=A0A1H5ZRJ6_9PSEU|nr:GMC family oxidoreductase [Saccharopolyspora kobensis]SEG38026.1 choline dehydrogenase [Saccharopolyspora kobensis]SFF22070.1 choline dehydrogenase [Saccharopolyspora kobensis]
MPKRWDLIVVGAGSAGAVLAARSAARGERVLLLEAGPDYRSAELPEVWRSRNPLRALLDPRAAGDLLQQGLRTRRTERQEWAPYVQGRGVGGSSSVNGHIAIRPPVEDFDDWVRMGCEGWSHAEVLPCFVKSEDDADFGDQSHHGRGGPIPVRRNPPESWGPADRALHDAALAAGFGWSPDVNAPGATGVSPYPTNARAGRRVSTNDGYLEPARSLPALTVRGHALVDRVLFSGNRAVGVRVLVDGRVVDEHADRVVLSAGAIHSPAILLRSGIGPARELTELGVEVRQDLPVGRGLQDHPLFFLGLPLSARASAGRSIDDRYTNMCVRYTSDAPDRLPHDMMLVACNQNVLSLASAEVASGAGALLVWVNRVFSRGSVTLASADPTAQPVLRHRMLSDPRDLARMRSGARLLLELGTSDHVQEVVDGSFAQVNEQFTVAAECDAALDDLLLRTAVDGQHATSTCRMGSPDSATTVVDSRCRVLGVEALHVVDASIFPTCPRANPNLVTIAAAELMADRLVR